MSSSKLVRRFVSRLPRGKGIAGRLISRHGRTDTFEMIGPLEGLRMQLDTADQFQALMSCGAYQGDLVAELQRTVKPNDVILTAGAHVGYMMLAMARMGGRVIGFECDPNLADLCQRNLDLNSLNTTLIRAGLGSEDTDLEMNISEHPGQSSFGVAHYSESKATVKVRRGDNVLKELGLERLDGLLIDVEGWECHLLRGLSETLAKQTPRWAVIECADWALDQAGSSVAELRSMIRDIGWETTEMGSDLICRR